MDLERCIRDLSSHSERKQRKALDGLVRTASNGDMVAFEALTEAALTHPEKRLRIVARHGVNAALSYPVFGSDLRLLKSMLGHRPTTLRGLDQVRAIASDLVYSAYVDAAFNARQSAMVVLAHMSRMDDGMAEGDSDEIARHNAQAVEAATSSVLGIAEGLQHGAIRFCVDRGFREAEARELFLVAQQYADEARTLLVRPDALAVHPFDARADYLMQRLLRGRFPPDRRAQYHAER